MSQREGEHGATTSLEVIDLRDRGRESGPVDDRGVAERIRETDHWDDEFTVEWAVSPRRSS